MQGQREPEWDRANPWPRGTRQIWSRRSRQSHHGLLDFKVGSSLTRRQQFRDPVQLSQPLLPHIQPSSRLVPFRALEEQATEEWLCAPGTARC